MTMKRWLQGAFALAIAAGGPSAFAADHLDGPGLSAEPLADITDVYGWVEGNKLLLVMNVGPLATSASQFSDALQYALHLESHSAYGMAGTKTDIIATFDTAQNISLWVGDGQAASARIRSTSTSKGSTTP
jgi:hypothetical protein